MLLVLVLVCGCGDEVVVRGSDTGGSDPGPPVAMPTSTGPTTTGPTGLACGSGNPPCPPNEYCDFPDAACGQGICATRPTECTDDCPGVCGCDAVFYCNTCSAQSNGVDSGDIACPNALDEEYVVVAQPGGLDHIFVLRADYTNDTCTRLHLAAPTMGSFPISTPPPWGVVDIAATNSSVQCLDVQVPPLGTPVAASAASGSVDFVGGMIYPCELSLDVTLVFDGSAPANILASGPLNVMGAVVVGGCF
jgi:hypothetical protein